MRIKSKRKQKYFFQVNLNQKKAGIIILLSNTEGLQILEKRIKRTISQQKHQFNKETSRNQIVFYATKNRTSKYLKPKLTFQKREIDVSITIFGEFNTPISETHKKNQQKYRMK